MMSEQPICRRCGTPPSLDMGAQGWMCQRGHHVEEPLRRAAVADAPPAVDQLPTAALPSAPHARPARAKPEEWPVIRVLAEVRAEPVVWLWPGRIPAGKVTLFDGNPGLGKSLLAVDIAARLTSGREMPDGSLPEIERRGVVLLTAEDGLEDTVRPRFDAAGGDPTRVRILEAVGSEAQERAVTLPEDIGMLSRAVSAAKAGLLVIDPLMAFLSAGLSTNSDQDVRRALSPLARLAQETGCAVLLIRHLNKAVGLEAMYRGGGSIGIIGAARSAFLIAADTTYPERRVLAPIKCNLAAMPAPLAYSVTEESPPRLEWHGEVSVTANALLAEQGSGDGPVVAWLRDQLAEGPHGATAIQRAAAQVGYTPAQLRTARQRLGVQVKREGFHADARWVWSLSEVGSRAPEAGSPVGDEPGSSTEPGGS